MSRYTIVSAIKTLDTLFAFNTAVPLSVEEIGQRTEQSRNQAFRCVKTLEEYGLIAERDGGYVLTPLLLTLLPALRHDPLLSVAEPYLRELQNRTDETVNLIVRLNQKETIVLATYPSHHSIRLVTKVGQVALLHAGAVPKAILAFSEDEEREVILSMTEFLPSYTEHTVRDANTLRAELAQTVERGYSVSDQDFEPGARGVGAPIFNRAGIPIGGISVGGPVIRVTEDQMHEWGAVIRETADKISAELGWFGGYQDTVPLEKSKEDLS